jgi:hypothetical protein
MRLNRHLIAPGILVGALVSALLLGQIGASDDELAQAQREDYCQAVSQWHDEAARGIAAEARFGHPDYHGIAAEQCPGMQPAASTQGVAFRAGNSSGLSNSSTETTERQLARQ